MFQLAKITKGLALLSLALNVTAALNKLEVQRRDIMTRDEIYRRDTPTHCVDDPLDSPSAGNLNCQDLGGIPPGKRLSLRDANGRLSCDECLGLNGNKPAVTENGVTECYITIDSSGDPGNRTSCPGDPAPTTNPDGTPGKDVSEGIMDAYCAVAGNKGLFGFATFAACYAYTFAEAGNNPIDQAEAGANLLCDTLFFGLCTAMENLN